MPRLIPADPPFLPLLSAQTLPTSPALTTLAADTVHEAVRQFGPG